MSTKTPRERLQELLEDKYPEICRVYSHNLGWHYSEPKELLSFIETLLEEARQETKEKCAKKAFDFADNLEKKMGVDASYARAVGNLIQSL